MLKNVWKSTLKVDHMAKYKSCQKEIGKLGRGTMFYVWTSFILHTSQTWVAHANLKAQLWWGRTHQQRGLRPSWRREDRRSGIMRCRPLGTGWTVGVQGGVIARTEVSTPGIAEVRRWRMERNNLETTKRSFLSWNPGSVIPEHSTCECCKKFSCQQRQHVHG